MQKNVAGQKIILFEFDYTTGAPKTGDAANLTAYVSKDDGPVTELTDVTATELDNSNAKGSYSFDLAQAETNADKCYFTGKSTTTNVAVVPLTVYTVPAGGVMAAASYQAVPVPPSLINVSIPSNTPFTKTFTQGDLRTNIADILVDATGTPLNLSGSTVAFRMISQADKSVKVNTASANLDDAPNGKVSYSWQSADLNTPGLYWGWWIVTTGGKTEHFPGDGEKMTVKVVPAE